MSKKEGEEIDKDEVNWLIKFPITSAINFENEKILELSLRER